MRFSAVAIAAALIAVANAQSDYFPFPREGSCIEACTDRIGKTRFPEYNDVDEYGARFIESISYSYESGSEKTRLFMNEVGQCMGSCPPAQLTPYAMMFPQKRTWYNANKLGTPPPRPTAVVPTATTSAPPVVTSIPPGVDPAYPFQPNGPCVANCINTVGKAVFPNFSEDPKSPYFWESLSYSFDSGSDKTREFMTDVGMCQGKCPAAENQLYSDQFYNQKQWYLANKPKTTTVAPTVPTTPPTTTTTSGPVPTGPVNPPGDYPFKPNGQCVAGCTNRVGKTMFPNYSEDPKSPYFIQSLSYTFESGSENTRKFMSEAGMCMSPCPIDELILYRGQFDAQKAWYNANKNGGTNPPVTTKPTTATTTSGPVPTGPVNPPGDYPFQPNGPCVSACTNKIGKGMFPNYTEDPKSPYFIQSLALSFESGSDSTREFMTGVGMCQGTCPAAENQLYLDQFPKQKEWYLANKNGGTNPPVTTKPTTTTTTSGPVPTGPVNPPGDYPFKPNGPCVSACTNKIGKGMFPNYTEDPKSPYFIQSLALSFESGSDSTREFMTGVGMCQGTCPAAENQLYLDQFPKQKEWYLANKNGGTNPPVITKPTTTTTSGPIPTSPVNPPSGGFNYPFKPNGPCVSACTNKIGKGMFPNYSEDPKSPYFIQSLALSFESGSDNTIKFMTGVGMCQGTCPAAENQLYLDQFNAQKAWYNANKSGGGNPTNPTNPGGEPTNPTGPPTVPPTGPITPPAGGFDYPFKPNGPCVSACTNKIGKEMLPNYSEDPKSPYFIQSLALSFESGSDNTIKFMTGVGMCQGTCPAAENQLYLDQFNAQKAWYNANKSGGGNPTNPTGPGGEPTNPTGPPTGPITPPAGGFDYPFQPNGPCVSACTNKIGKEMFADYTEDPKSPYFIQSLALSFESGSDNTIKFMTGVGMCQGACPAAENQLYLDQFPKQKEWYLANKNASVNATTTPIGPITPTDPITGQPTALPGTGDKGANGAVKFAASGLATLLAVVSAFAVAL